MQGAAKGADENEEEGEEEDEDDEEEDKGGEGGHRTEEAGPSDKPQEEAPEPPTKKAKQNATEKETRTLKKCYLDGVDGYKCEMDDNGALRECLGKLGTRISCDTD